MGTTMVVVVDEGESVVEITMEVSVILALVQHLITAHLTIQVTQLGLLNSLHLGLNNSCTQATRLGPIPLHALILQLLQGL